MNEISHIDNHGFGAAILAALAIDVEPHGKVLRIGDLISGNQPRTNGTEGVASLALVPSAATLDLVFALGHVIDHAVSRDMLERIGQADITRLGTYYDTQLDFPIGLDGTLWNNHGVIGACGPGPLIEQNGFLGHFGASLGSMIAIVQPHANKLAHT